MRRIVRQQDERGILSRLVWFRLKAAPGVRDIPEDRRLAGNLDFT
jgi:hypothetical protein